jgi:glycerol-3-phosphate cytidylyltransferase-like family protein
MDYRIDIQNPFMAGLQGFQAAQQMTLQQQQLQQQRSAQQRQAQMQKDLADFSAKQGKQPEDYRRMMTQYPEISKQINQSLSMYNEEQRQNKIDQLLPVYAALRSNNVDQAKGLIDEYRIAAENSGDSQQAKTLDLLKQQMDIEPKGALTSSRLFLYGAMGENAFLKMDQATKPGNEIVSKSDILPDGTTIMATSLGNLIVKNAQGQTLTGQDAADAIRNARKFGIDLEEKKTAAREEGKLSIQNELKAMVEEKVSEAKARGKGTEDLATDIINRGYSAAETLPTLNRGIELLESVKTGPFENVVRRAKGLFGVEGGDEGELSYNLSMSVLQQLRPIFGAAFTAREGESLMKISQGFGKSPEVNKRLLKQIKNLATNAAKRAILRANRRGDTDTAEEIRSLMGEMLGEPTAGTEQQTTKLTRQPPLTEQQQRAQELINALKTQ